MASGILKAMNLSEITVILICVSLLNEMIDVDFILCSNISSDLTDVNVTCSTCTKPLTQALKDIHQDTLYANKSIDYNRIKSKLNRKSDELSATIEEHKIGLSGSRAGFMNSLNYLSSLHSHSDSHNLTSYMIAQSILDRLILASNSQNASVFDQDKSFGELEFYHIYLTSMVYLLSDLVGTTLEVFADSARELGMMNEDYHLNEIGQLRQASPSDGLIRFNLYTSRDLLVPTRTSIEQQRNYEKGFQTLLGNIFSRNDKISSLIQKISDLKHSSILLASTFRDELDTQKTLFEDVDRYNLSIIESKRTVTQLEEINHLIELNAEREGDERLLVNDIVRHLRSIDSKLRSVASKFNHTSKHLVELETKIDDVNRISKASLPILANLTNELKVSNKELTEILGINDLKEQDRRIRNRVDEIGRLHAEAMTTFYEVAPHWRISSLVDDIIDDSIQIESLSHQIDMFMAKSEISGSDLESSLNKSRALLHWTKNHREHILSACNSRLGWSKSMIVSSALDLEQNRADLNRLNLSTSNIIGNKILRSLVAEIDELKEASISSENSTTIMAELSADFWNQTNQMERYLVESFQTSQKDFDLLSVIEPGEISDSVHHKLQELETKINDYSTISQIRERTKFASMEVRELIDGLLRKTKVARDLMDGITFSRKLHVSGLASDMSPPFGRLKMSDLQSDCCSTQTTVSFLLAHSSSLHSLCCRPILFIGNRRGLQSAEDNTRIDVSDYSEYMLVTVTGSRLSLSLKLGPASREFQLRDGQTLENGQIYRVTILKSGTQLTLSLSSKFSRNSVSRSIPSLETVLSFNQNETEILLGQLPHSSFKDRFCDGGLVSVCDIGQNSSLIMDDLKINGEKVGLWNLLLNKLPPMPGINSYLGDRMEENQEQWSNAANSLRLLNEKAMTAALSIPAAEKLYPDQRDGNNSKTLVSFSRPKSNISSSYFQLTHQSNELGEFILQNGRKNRFKPLSSPLGHIYRISLRFRTKQANGLLLHHALSDHSSFMSVYLSNGLLMLAIDLVERSRTESHLRLNDGNWHSLHIMIKRRVRPIYRRPSDTPQSKNNDNKLSKSSLTVLTKTVIDDKYLYLDRFESGPIFEATRDPNPKENFRERRNQQNGSINQNRSEDDTFRRRKHHSWLGDEIASSEWRSHGRDEFMANKTSADPHSPIREQSAELITKFLYFGGVEDKYIPLIRSQQIPTNFHGCLGDVAINDVPIDFQRAHRNQGTSVGQCQLD